jgi:hypothetical protein
VEKLLSTIIPLWLYLHICACRMMSHFLLTIYIFFYKYATGLEGGPLEPPLIERQPDRCWQGFAVRIPKHFQRVCNPRPWTTMARGKGVNIEKWMVHWKFGPTPLAGNEYSSWVRKRTTVFCVRLFLFLSPNEPSSTKYSSDCCPRERVYFAKTFVMHVDRNAPDDSPTSCARVRHLEQ